jgi:hypothetical protein
MKYARLSNSTVVETVHDAEYQTFNATVKAMFQECPETVERRWQFISGEWVEPEPVPEPEPMPQALTKLAFIRLCQSVGGMTSEMTVAAHGDAHLRYMWLMFEIAAEVERDDPDTQGGLDALSALGYLPNGKQSVADAWPIT